MRRIPELLIAALASAAAVVWLLALLTSLPPPLPTVVVQGEPAIAKGAPWALRIVAVVPGGSAPLDVTGAVRLGDATAPIANGTARIDVGSSGTAEIDVVANGVAMHGALEVHEGAPPPASFTWSTWQHEIALASSSPSQAPSARDPVYPLDGRVSARLPSRALVFHADGTHAVEVLSPSAQGPLLADGRVLAVDRSGLRIETRLVPDATVAALSVVDVHLLSAEPRTVSCDLVVDGAVHDVATVDVASDATVRLRVGAPPGDVAVVHCGGPWPDERGRTAIARLGSAPTATMASWVRRHAVDAGAPEDEPVLGALGVLDESDAVRAALGRLVPSKVRAPKLEVAWDVDTGPSVPFRAAYAGLAVLVVLGTLALGFARLRERRGAVVAGALVLAAMLAGLYAALVVIAR